MSSRVKKSSSVSNPGMGSGPPKFGTKTSVSRRTLSSKADVLPHSIATRFCPFVAQWFTTSQAVVKTSLLLLSTLLMGLILSWKSEGVTISDLTDEENNINYRNYIYCYVGIACLTVIYSISMTILGCGGIEIPANMQAVITAIYLFLWLVSSACISGAMDALNNTKYIRERGIDILFLRLANFFGFVVVFLFVVDILLAFMALTAMENNFTEEKMVRSISYITNRNSYIKHVTGRGVYRPSKVTIQEDHITMPDVQS